MKLWAAIAITLVGFSAFAQEKSDGSAIDKRFAVTSPEGKTILSSNAIYCVYSYLSKDGEKRSFNVFLNEKDADSFSEYTSQNINNQIYLLIGGNIISKPVIKTEISSDVIVFEAQSLEEGLEFSKIFADFKNCNKDGEIGR